MLTMLVRHQIAWAEIPVRAMYVSTILVQAITKYCIQVDGLFAPSLLSGGGLRGAGAASLSRDAALTMPGCYCRRHRGLHHVLPSMYRAENKPKKRNLVLLWLFLPICDGIVCPKVIV